MGDNADLHDLFERVRQAMANTGRFNSTGSDNGASSPPGYFERNTEMRAEVVEGIFREGQLVILAGPYGVGKTPAQIDLAVAIAHGLPWCGRTTQRRPVIAFDLETAGPTYKRSVRNICQRRRLPLPSPELLEVYLQNDSGDEPNTVNLLKALATRQSTLALIAERLKSKPNVVVFMDPIEMLFRADTRDKMHVLQLYRELRILLNSFPAAAIWSTFNLRKRDRRASDRASLLTDPRTWLEEVSGTLDILNRSDVRLGMDAYSEGIRVINGIRRSEEMHPFLLRPLGDTDEELAGFELVAAGDIELKFVFSSRQLAYWEKLPREFRFEEATRIVPRSSLFRLIARAKSLGVVERDEATGFYRKTWPQ